MHSFDLQPTLKNEFITILPLQLEDFESLYIVASDPLIWEQHPNKDRYQRSVFEIFFKGAIESKGAFKIFDTLTNDLIGSTRYYDLDLDQKKVSIGYTFLACDHWGTTYNRALKTCMLDYAFLHLDTVIFHIGACNIRSQKAIERLGAYKIKELEVAYYGEPPKINFEYAINRNDWRKSIK